MRVLMLIDGFRLGGAETLLAQLATVSRSAGFEMDVLSLSPKGEQTSTLEPLLEQAGLAPRYVGARRTLDPVMFAGLVRTIRASGCDVVHAHLEMAITMGVPAAALAGTPAVCTFHHVVRPLTGRAAARERLAVEVASRSQAAIFVSQASLDSFAQRYRPRTAPPRSWTVVHNGIDLTRFTPEVGEVRTGRPPAAPVVTCLAALRDFKGIEHLVTAWPAVLARHPAARLRLVGSGEQEGHLRQRVQDCGIGGSVEFAGMRSDVVDVLRASDVVVLPSVYGENLPTVLMEAAGCGRPVVASRVGGIADIVQDGVTGLLVSPGDPVELAAAVSGLLDDPERGERMGAAARVHMLERFDAGLWAQRLKAVYDTALTRTPVAVAA